MIYVKRDRHITVLKKEIVDLLQPKRGGAYVDLTLGGGGHSLEILDQLHKGVLIAFDIDPRSIESFTEQVKSKFNTQDLAEDKANKQIQRFQIADNELILVNDNFENLREVLDELKIKRVDGIIADLGWSTEQLGEIEGLSFEKLDKRLDMRFSKDLGVTAADLLNVLSKKELAKMFEENADIKGGFRAILVNGILRERRYQRIEKVATLNKLIEKARKYSKDMYKDKARVFQALRIAVNSEFDVLKNMLEGGVRSLNTDGRFLLITFHSGEEKIVTEFFNKLTQPGSDVINGVEKPKLKYAYITGDSKEKFNKPGEEEIEANKRARSAKLFGIEAINN